MTVLFGLSKILLTLLVSYAIGYYVLAPTYYYFIKRPEVMADIVISLAKWDK